VSAPPASLHEVARFLSGFAPFDALAADELEALAASATIEFARRGEEIFGQGLAGQGSSFVVRSGVVELVDGDDVIDVLAPGETFGHRSMMTGLPTSVAARAREDTLLYRLAGDVVRPLLARPEGLRFVVRTLLDRSRAEQDRRAHAADLALTSVGDLARGTAVICDPETTIREAARRMTDAGQSAVLVPCEQGWGILTDSDLRARVVGGPVSRDDPVTAAMTVPAFTAGAGRRGSDVMLEMLDRRINHVPVLGERDQVVGVARTADLLAAQARTPFLLREAIAGAADRDEVAAAARRRTETVVALHGAGLDAANVGAMLAVLDDAVVRRLVELGHERLGPPPLPVGWLVFGSGGRRETALSSDLDCGLHWVDHGDDGEHADAAAAWAGELASFVLDGVAACGIPVDEHGVRADNPLVARPLSAWQQLVDRLAADPYMTNAMALVMVLADGRAVTGPPDAAGLIGFVHEAVHRPAVRDLLRQIALRDPPKAGSGAVDLKRSGIGPIADLARWAGVSAGMAETSTRQRLRAAAAAGVIDDADARTLIEAHLLLGELRLDHQIAQATAGEPLGDEVDLDALDPLTRTYAREALREAAHARRRLQKAT
jgi:CBS domain-containing protein